MKKKYLVILLVTIISNGLIAQKKVYSLDKCIETTLANNRNIKQKEIATKTAAIAYEQSKLNLLPTVSGSASQGWSFGRSQLADGTYKNINSSNSSFGISAGLTLFDGLRMKHNIDARLSEMKATEADLEMVRRDVIMSVSTAFLNVLLKKELLQISNEQLALTRTKIDQQKVLISAGKLAEGEIYELLAQEAKENQSRVQAENNLEQSLLDLAQIMEISDFENLDIEIPQYLSDNELVLLNPQNVYDSALIVRPDIKSAEFRLKNSEKNVNIARSGYYPTIYFGTNVGGGYYNSVSVPLNTSIGFNMSVPIFNKLETRNQVRTAKLNFENDKLNLENSKIQLRKNIQQAYHNAISAKARWDAAQKSETAAREAFRFTEKKYESGKATVYELYQAKNNLSLAQSEIAQSKYEYIFRVKLLEWMM